MMNVVGVILGGGAGTRLQPLTRDRAKPAVPLAGKYRLVDIPITNCINSGIKRIYLLTQFNSVSLHEHVHSTYHFDQFNHSFVRILAAQQTPEADTWYSGTADAVRKSFRYCMDEYPDYVVILSGDQLYRMNFQDVLKFHIDAKAEVTIATKPVARKEAGGLGIMQVDKKQKIINFHEKPGDTPELSQMRAPIYEKEAYLASMGIYIFNTPVLRKMLETDLEDFGKGIIPEAINNHNVYSYIFNGYWKDIGTIGTFFEANLNLTEIVPEFTFYDAKAPIYTHRRFLPPSKINKCEVRYCLLTEGCIISGMSLRHCVVGVRARVGDGSTIKHSILMGADYYEEMAPPVKDAPPIGIGRNCTIKNAIIDKNVRIGDRVSITPDGKSEGEMTDLYTVRDGVIVIPKNAVIPDDTVL